MLRKSFSSAITAASICFGCLIWAASAHASTVVNFGFNTTGDGNAGWTFFGAGAGATGDGSPQSPSFAFLAQNNESIVYQQSSYATASATLGSDPLVQGTYTITFITAPTAGPSPITAMDVTAFDATKGGTQLGTLQYAYNQDTMKSWQTVNFSFNTTAANVGDYLVLQFSAIPSSVYPSSNYWFGVDTITGTVAVPEPAGLGLLAAGALGLLLLKRRRAGLKQS